MLLNQLITTADIIEINYLGVQYDSNNPNPSGWTIRDSSLVLVQQMKIPSNIT